MEAAEAMKAGEARKAMEAKETERGLPLPREGGKIGRKGSLRGIPLGETHLLKIHLATGNAVDYSLPDVHGD